MSARVLVAISYAAVRRVDPEEGAVQRLLNTSRISSLKEFIVNGGDYPNCIILNWSDKTAHLKVADNKLSFELKERLAQIIDGQHRVEGLRAAIKERKSLEQMEIPVAVYSYLQTRECADIFLAINTEQKPVAKSLVYDLYGIASEHLVDPASVRANDIAAS